MKTRLLLMLALVCAGAARVAAQTPVPTTPTMFTYQGRVTAGDKPATGMYDFQFRLFDVATGGLALANLNVNQVAVSNSVFTVQLDYGPQSGQVQTFNGDQRWLEIRLRPSTDVPIPYTVLTPRQPITSAPYSYFSYNSASAAVANSAKTADVLLGSVTDNQLPAGLARLSADQTFAGINHFNGSLIAVNPVNLFVGTFSGSGVGLTSLNAAALSSGTVADARLGPNIPRLNAGNSFAGNNIFNGRVGINTPTPATALHIEDFDATVRMKNRNDLVGAFVGDTYSALQLGMYNPSTQILPRIPALSSRSFFAISMDGRVGSTVNAFIGDPVYRNLLDDGDGNLVVSGSIEALNPGQTLQLLVSPSPGQWVPGLRIVPSLVPGGVPHLVGGDGANAVSGSVEGSSISGGGRAKFPNLIASSYSVIAGGLDNQIASGSDRGVIGGGTGNRISDSAQHGTIAGGFQNTIAGKTQLGMIPGGNGNVVSGLTAFAAGYFAQAIHDGAFVWADSYALNGSHPPFLSTQPNEFSVRATGGTRIVSGIIVQPGSPPFPVGVSLKVNSGSWSTLSDRNAKTQFTPVSARDILAKVAALPVQGWRYKGEADSIRHLGPVAQDFHAAFGLGSGDTTIDTVDADGVALAAIQGLNQKVADQAAEIRELRALVGQLARQMEGLTNSGR